MAITSKARRRAACSVLWIVLFVGVALPISAQMREMRVYQKGVLVGGPGMSMKYPIWTAGVWHATGPRSWMQLTAGLSGRGQLIERSSTDALFRESLRRMGVSLQYMYTDNREQIVQPFVSGGAYWMHIRAEVGKNFIYDMPRGAMTVHDGAHFSARRFGVLPGFGLRVHLHPVCLETQMMLPIYYESSSFRNVKDPLLVVDFVPETIRHYQRGGDRINAGFVWSITAGIAW